MCSLAAASAAYRARETNEQAAAFMYKKHSEEREKEKRKKVTGERKITTLGVGNRQGC